MNVSIHFNTTNTVSPDSRPRAHVLHDVALETAIAISMALRGHEGVEAVIVVAGSPAEARASGPRWPGAGLLARLHNILRGQVPGLHPVPL